MIRLIIYINCLSFFFIFRFMFFCIINHHFNFFLTKTTWSFNPDTLFFTCRLILSSNIKYSIRINVKCYFNLRNTPRCWWNSIKMKLAYSLIINGHFSLSLENMNFYRRLTISSCRKNLALLSWNGCISIYQPREHPTQSFYTQRKWCHI